ncbi:MAG: sensor domain-containing diguanylate cyclase [Methylococcaceae bacterium]|nr:sensor domain-containing diguanylate cyclase [Methylococcaceae bacterium]
MKVKDVNKVDILDFQSILVDLLNSLAVVRSLSEIENHQNNTNEKDLVLNALNILMSNQDMERCSFFIKITDDYLVNLTGLSAVELSNGEHEMHKPLTFKIGEGIIGLAAQLGELQYCADCYNDKRFAFVDKRFSPGSIISVPVMALGELFGVLNISHPEAHYFSDWHIRLLEIYKNMLGQLISNFRLLKKMELHIAQKTEHLENALAEASELKARYESLSMKDSLTGLYNRRFFYAQVTQAVSRTGRSGDALCILLIDLDFFKAINDDYGHGCGDQVLVDVANALKREMRDSDIVARFGGEEFVVLFSQPSSNNGLIFAERICKEIAALQWVFNQKQISISASIGMFCVTQQVLQEQGDDIDSFIHYADVAMYKAKDLGKNQVVVFTEDLLAS